MRSTGAATVAPQLSIVVPAYGCVGTLHELHSRLSCVLRDLVERYEIIFVDDRGKQDQWPVLCEIAAHDPNTRIVRMSRNYGQQIAITAGLAECRGDYAIVMDCDLQDPPEVIPQLWNSARDGYDIVYASRRRGDQQTRKFVNRVYFRLMKAVTGYDADPSQGAFSLISRQVIEAYLQFGERERHYLFILRWLGFDSTSINYERHERTVGKSSYTFSTLVKHALQGFFFHSTVPLIWMLWFGLICATVSLALGVFFVINALLGKPPEGFTTLVVIQLLIGGVVLTCIGTVGLYIARIFESTKGRPLYLIDRSTSRSALPQDGSA